MLLLRLSCAAAILWCAGAAFAADAGVEGKKLVIVDGGLSGNDKIAFVAKGADLTKGAGTDPATISATIELSRGEIGGAVSIPAGPLGPGVPGWRQNDGSPARYQNSSAASGVPTGARSLVVKPGKLLKLTTRTLGDVPIDFAAFGASTSTLRTVATIENDGEIFRHCTAFPAAGIKRTGPNGSGRSKLVARNGIPTECPGLVLFPNPPLPFVALSARLYFDAASPSALAAAIARVSHPETAGYFSSFRATVDGALGSLPAASDDTRAKVAKAAGLLHVLGQTPPGGSGFSSYRDVAVTALLGIVDRTALDSVAEFVTPPANLLHVLQDSGRLQSMTEAYDFLRGTGIAPGDDAIIRALIATWADAYVQDWNLIGDPFGLFAGHRDNWAIKAGSALVTTALALPGHASAPTWLAAGLTYLNESLRNVVMAPGWYAESPHYVNYSLNNLASTAWHVRNATGEDWFDDLAPLVDVALALRQPDGQSAAFEEGVPNVFPHDVLAAAYPTRAAQMLWAWNQSSQNPVNYDNQQIHSVTRFLVADLVTLPSAPTGAATTFLDGDTHVAALRSGWGPGATQLTSFTALDHASTESVSSRHNMENPLDVTLFAAGAMLLPTASGGPQVTSSANRAVYLEPGSKNIPLVDGDAPYLVDPLAAQFGERLDGEVVDTASTLVATFAAGVSVERTVALVGDEYGVVVDQFHADAPREYGATWRGRGDASVRSLSPTQLGVDYDWPTSSTPTAHLAVDVAASSPLTGIVDASLYAPAWGVEETIAPLRVSATGSVLHFLTVLRPRANGAPPSAITSVGGGTTAAFRVTLATTEHLIATGGGAPLVADGVTSDGTLAIVRRESGVTTSLTMVRGTSIDAGPSAGVLESDEPATVSVAIAAGSARVDVSPDVADSLRVTLRDLPSLSGTAAHAATFDGEPLTGGSFSQSGTEFHIRVPHGGTVAITPVP